MQPTVLCDVDDVVLDLLHEWLLRYRQKTGDMLYPQHLKQWDLVQALASPDHETLLYKILKEPDLYTHIEPVYGALEGLTAIRNAGIRVVFVTAANPEQMGPKYYALVRHGFLQDTAADGWRNYITATDKSLVRASLGIIDDRLSTVWNHPDGGIVFDRPHNRDTTGMPALTAGPVQRAVNWPAVVNYVLDRHAQRPITKPYAC